VDAARRPSGSDERHGVLATIETLLAERVYLLDRALGGEFDVVP